MNNRIARKVRKIARDKQNTRYKKSTLSSAFKKGSIKSKSKFKISRVTVKCMAKSLNSTIVYAEQSTYSSSMFSYIFKQ